MDIYELAEDLAQEIEESGKTKWSAKDVKNFFLSEGVNLSLDEILQVWKACPSPVCACKLLGCDQIIEASSGYEPQDMQSDLSDLIADALSTFMENWSDYISDIDELLDMVDSEAEHWAVSSDYFEQ